MAQTVKVRLSLNLDSQHSTQEAHAHTMFATRQVSSHQKLAVQTKAFFFFFVTVAFNFGAVSEQKMGRGE